MTIAMGSIPRRLWTGLSGDTKPTDTIRVNQNDLFFETDTGLYSVFNGVSWFSYPVSGSASAVKGTTTNDNAPAGFLGEFITATVASGAAVALTSTVQANIASISLTAGDWDVSAVADLLTGAATSVSFISAGLGTVSATQLTQVGGGGVGTDPLVTLADPAFVPGVTTLTLSLPPVRVSLAATTTIFFVALCTFTVSTLSAFGTIRARRMR